LKAPGTERLKLEYDELLSNFASNFNCAATSREKAAFLEKRAKKAAKKSQGKVVMTR
jgi:hypothetical protein